MERLRQSTSLCRSQVLLLELGVLAVNYFYFRCPGLKVDAPCVVLEGPPASFMSCAGVKVDAPRVVFYGPPASRIWDPGEIPDAPPPGPPPRPAATAIVEDATNITKAVNDIIFFIVTSFTRQLTTSGLSSPENLAICRKKYVYDLKLHIEQHCIKTA